MKKVWKVLVGCLMFVLLLVGCAEERRGTRYNLTDIDFANITVEHYDYSYIEFNFENNTYYLENKAKANGIVSRQSGNFIVDANNYVTITNNDIPTQNYLLYPGETLRFDGDNFYASAYISGYGNASLTFTK